MQPMRPTTQLMMLITILQLPDIRCHQQWYYFTFISFSDIHKSHILFIHVMFSSSPQVNVVLLYSLIIHLLMKSILSLKLKMTILYRPTLFQKKITWHHQQHSTAFKHFWLISITWFIPTIKIYSHLLKYHYCYDDFGLYTSNEHRPIQHDTPHETLFATLLLLFGMIKLLSSEFLPTLLDC